MKVSTLFSRKKSFKGGVDGIAGGVIFGWAVDSAATSKFPEIEIFIGNTLAGKTLANLPRSDIAHATNVAGRCGFIFDLRPHLGSLPQTIRVREAISGHELTGSPIEANENTGWGVLDSVEGVSVMGWAVVADPTKEHAVVEIIVDGKLEGKTIANLSRTDLRLAGLPRSQCGFHFTLPAYLFDGESHNVGARIAGCDQALRGGAKKFRAKIKGYVDHFSPERVSGWAVNLHALDVPLKLDVYLDDDLVGTAETTTQRQDVAISLGLKEGAANFGFDIALPQSGENWNTKRLRVCIADTDCLIGEKETVIFRNDFVIGVLENIAVQFRDVDNAADSLSDLALVRKYIINQSINQFRNNYGTGYISVDIPRAHFTETECNSDGAVPVDVIVPVYKGYQETLDCIHSVLRSRTENNFELIVINDHGPDTKLTAELRRLAATGSKFTLLENQKNLGFVATANRGMKLHPERDVILLNSDTVVPADWLKGMRRAAYSAPNIGTVTPFSNRATICSLPRTCFDNDMPLDLSVEDLNTLCAQANPCVVIDIPTAIGFAMYIRRDTLNEVGYFDEEKWDKGYGEENDFCIRAAAQGWRNVAACDVFVQHHGSVSFDTDKAPRVRENLAKLNQLYPDYPGKIQRFLRADPLSVPRGRVNAELMKRLSPNYILFVTHGLGGGTEKAIRDLCDIHAKDGKQVLILRSSPSGKMELSPAIADYEKTLITEYPHGTHAAVLAEQLRGLSITYVHLHHTLGFTADIWQLPELLGVPYDVMIHDFYLVCPRINLIDDTGVYCGQPSIAACERCVTANKLDHDVEERLEEVGGTVAHWRKFHAAQLRGARKVVVPSNNARAHIQKYLPDQPIEAVPHPEPEFIFKQREWDGSLPYRVAVLGAIGPHKGVNVLLACAKYAERRELPIKFVVIGYTSCDEAFAKLKNVQITGPYKPEELHTIVADTRCIASLFLSVWPETFSYTLSEAWHLGLHPVAIDIGAQAERIKEMQIGTVIPFSQDPQIILPALLDALDRLNPHTPT